MPIPKDALSITTPIFIIEPSSNYADIETASRLIYPVPEAMPCNLHLVTADSPRRYKGAVETLAWYFRREFHFDFPGYTADEITSDDSVRSFFWTEEHGKGHRVIGACTFRKREWKNLPEVSWTLCWIWLHPFRRGCGLLTQAWPFFTAMFEPLDIERPISPAMEAFLSNKPHTTIYTTDTNLPIKLYTRPKREMLEVEHDQ